MKRYIGTHDWWHPLKSDTDPLESLSPSGIWLLRKFCCVYHYDCAGQAHIYPKTPLRTLLLWIGSIKKAMR